MNNFAGNVIKHQRSKVKSSIFVGNKNNNFIYLHGLKKSEKLIYLCQLAVFSTCLFLKSY